MTSRQEIGALKQAKLDEIARLQHEISALETVENLLSQQMEIKPIQQSGLFFNMPPDLPPSEVVLRVLARDRERFWLVSDIVEAAEDAGRDISKWKNPKNSIAGAALVLAKENKVYRGVLDGRPAYRHKQS